MVWAAAAAAAAVADCNMPSSRSSPSSHSPGDMIHTVGSSSRCSSRSQVAEGNQEALPAILLDHRNLLQAHRNVTEKSTLYCI